eukprot:1335816-Prymnesium_polylepis.1
MMNSDRRGSAVSQGPARTHHGSTARRGREPLSRPRPCVRRRNREVSASAPPPGGRRKAMKNF